MSLCVYDALNIQNLNNAMGQFNGGFFRICPGSQPAVNTTTGTGTVITQLQFQNPAFPTPTASGGLTTTQAYPLTPDLNAVGGIPGFFVCYDAFGDPLCTGTVAPSGADFNFPFSIVAAGQHIQVNSFVLVMLGRGS